MRPLIPSFLAWILCAGPALATGDAGKILMDTWEIAFLGDGKAGHVRTTAREYEADGVKLIRTTVELRLRVKRFSDIVEMAMDTGTIETADGTVTAVFMKQYLGKQQRLQVEGTVVGKLLRLTLNGKTPLKPAPWNSDVVGLYKQQTLLKDRKAKPGEKISFASFEPTINLVLKTEMVVKGYREVALKGSREKRKLLLVETIPQKVDFKRGSDKIDKIQLPISLTWFDENFEPVKTEVEVPGLGPLVMYRTTREKALAPAPIAKLTDIGISQLVRLKNRILKPYETAAARYRVTIRNDDDPASTFSRDDRQQVKNVQGNTFELHVKASNLAGGGKEKNAPDAEFLQSSYFITSDDAKVMELSRKAIGEETDPWQKARRIERWVHNNMRVTAQEALATADHVARTLEGDCTEYAMLTVAMCRAAKVPSRTAIGLIYADVKGAPCFAFHMWAEVWVKGRWIPLDATLGKGYVGATHLKITDHSWHDERTMTPIFPVIRVVGRVSIEVLGAENR
ncbi:MAG: transglutaminase domain-containing protein [Planctomycetes bacterium]|nr:transglutaminase domain-containing protein [Planctomycetota bacterium]